VGATIFGATWHSCAGLYYHLSDLQATRFWSFTEENRAAAYSVVNAAQHSCRPTALFSYRVATTTRHLSLPPISLRLLISRPCMVVSSPDSLVLSPTYQASWSVRITNIYLRLIDVKSSCPGFQFWVRHRAITPRMFVSMPRTSHCLLRNFPRCVFGVYLNTSISTNTITDKSFTTAPSPVLLSTLCPQIIDGSALYISAKENPETDVFVAPVPIRNRFPTILLVFIAY
jgi:hypothetical protein